MTFARSPLIRMVWRLFLTHLGVGLAVLLLGALAARLLIFQEMTALHQREVAYLSAAVSRPDFPLGAPGEPDRAYLLRAGEVESLLISRHMLDLVRAGHQVTEFYRLPDDMPPVVPRGGEPPVRPPPLRLVMAGDTEQYLLGALRDLPADSLARLVVASQQVILNRPDPAAPTVILVPLPGRPPVHGVLVVAIHPGMLDSLLHSVNRWSWAVAGFVLVLAALSAWVLARSQISEARAQFQQAEQARRDLVASVSHEFRAPLASLRGYLELIRDGVIQPGEQGRYVNVMLEDALRLNRLVEDLLDLARIQARQVSLHLVHVDPAEAVHRVVEQAGWKVGSGIALMAELQPDLPAVLADRDRLDQVLTNLVENALRYAGSGGWVRVTAEGRDGYVTFSVHDSGPGIASEEQGRVWERFHKVERARTPGSSGTGLGLAIVKELVEAMGGQAGLVSAPGRGSTFWFTVPANGHQG